MCQLCLPRAHPLDADLPPEDTAAWRFVLTGELVDPEQILSSGLGILGFGTEQCAPDAALEHLRHQARTILVAPMTWLAEQRDALRPLLPNLAASPFSAPLILGWVDSDEPRIQADARLAGARLAIDASVGIEHLISELAGVAWMPRRPYRALLVDDDDAILRSCSRTLKHAGCEVACATDPLEALDLSKELRPEVCVLDMEMPGCRGSDLAALLRRDKDLARLPMIFLSAFDDLEHQLAARFAGSEDYLVKPADLKLLVGAVIAKARAFRLLEKQAHRHRLAWSGPGNLEPIQAVSPPAEQSEARARLSQTVHRDQMRGIRLPPRILVVDDDPLIRALMRLLLSKIGITDVLLADDGESALELIERERIRDGLLITDLSMPGMDGIEFLRVLAERGYGGPIAVLSGVDERLLQSTTDLARAKDLDLIGTLNKPVDPDRLLHLLIQAQERPRRAKQDQRDEIALTRNDILAGIQGDAFEVHFQPKVDAATLRPVGVEALARWRHGGRSVAPDHFIALAEQEGLIAHLSAKLVTKALVGGVRFIQTGFPLSLAINLSANWLSDVRLPELIITSLRRTGFPSERLILEITETGLMSDITTALDILTRLRLKGVKLSIDDFGIGYSSMEQLQRLPFTEMKLDRTFLRDAHERSAARAILASSIEMAKRLGLTTVAEGVETQADLDLMRNLGCDLVQGWLVARAMPADRLIDWLRVQGMAR